MKKLTLLLMAAGLAAVALNTSNFNRSTEARNFTVIDGAKNAELIPDRVAYSLMLRLISSPRNEPEKTRMKSYVANIGFQSEADTKALLSAAEDYGRRVGALDTQVDGIKEKERHNQDARSPEMQRVLRQLQSEYDLVTDDVMASLTNDLSKAGVAALQRFINEKFKAKVKLQPTTMPKL